METRDRNTLMETVERLLQAKDYKTLKAQLTELYPVDVAEVLDKLSEEKSIIVFRLLHKDQAADVFSFLEGERRKDLATTIHDDLLRYIFNELYFDDKIDFLEEMPANFVNKVLANTPTDKRELINQFLQYPEYSAGSLMTIEYVSLQKTMTVREALARIREIGVDSETIYTCYVLDSTRRLEGVLSLRRLVLADEDMRVEDLMKQEIVQVNASDDQEEVAEIFKKYDLIAVPVVDAEHRMIGIITIDDIVDVIEQENTEDFHKMAAMAPTDTAYLDTGVFQLARHRIVWLLLLMISATFTGKIISHYEGMLSAVVVLTAFIPMLMDSGGNAGSQSSTLIIRGIALGDIQMRDWPKILWKELRVGLIAGGIMLVVNSARMLLFESVDISIVITVSLTLLLTIVAAKLVGGILPILAKAIKVDPAIMAGPLITTVVDAFSLVIYFRIAGMLVL